MRVVGYVLMKHTNRGKRITLIGCLYYIATLWNRTALVKTDMKQCNKGVIFKIFHNVFSCSKWSTTHAYGMIICVNNT